MVVAQADRINRLGLEHVTLMHYALEFTIVELRVDQLLKVMF